MRPPPSKCDSAAYFFKFIPPAGLKSQLEIPTSFRKYLKHRRNNKTAILRRGCQEWRVKTDGWAFGEGWESFVRENGVQDCDFLIFKHEGDMVFETMVFDTTCCEREYPTNQVEIMKAEKECPEAKESGKCTEMDIDASKILKRKHAYIEKSTKSPLKNDKAMISDEDHHSYLNVTLNSSCKYRLYLPTDFTSSNGLSTGEMTLKNGQTQESWKVRINVCSGNAYCLGQGWHDFCIANGLKDRDCLKLEIVRAGTDPIAIVHRLSEETPNRKATTVMVETEDSSSHCYFDGTLKEYDGTRKFLYVPMNFAFANRLSDGEIILRNEENKGSWIAKLTNHKGKYFSIRRGLHEFCAANGLRKGTKLRLKILQNGEKPVASISRVLKETPEVALKETSKVALKETSKVEAVQNPYFKSTITAYSIKESFVNVPMDFARSNGLDDANLNGEMLVNDEKNRLWQTNLCITHNRVRIRQFRDILVENGLKEGDEFSLELAPFNKMPVMIFRSLKTA